MADKLSTDFRLPRNALLTLRRQGIFCGLSANAPLLASRLALPTRATLSARLRT